MTAAGVRMKYSIDFSENVDHSNHCWAAHGCVTIVLLQDRRAAECRQLHLHFLQFMLQKSRGLNGRHRGITWLVISQHGNPWQKIVAAKCKKKQSHVFLSCEAIAI